MAEERPLPSESEAFANYMAHANGCATCKPTAGVACAEGRELHDLWKEAEARAWADVKYRERRRTQPAPRRPHTRRGR